MNIEHLGCGLASPFDKPFDKLRAALTDHVSTVRRSSVRRFGKRFGRHFDKLNAPFTIALTVGRLGSTAPFDLAPLRRFDVAQFDKLTDHTASQAQWPRASLTDRTDHTASQAQRTSLSKPGTLGLPFDKPFDKWFDSSTSLTASQAHHSTQGIAQGKSLSKLRFTILE